MAEAVVKKAPCGNEVSEEIDMLRGTVTVGEVMEMSDMRAVEAMWRAVLQDICEARVAVKGKRYGKLDKEGILGDIHKIENYIKQNFPPKEPTSEDEP